jgi:putative ATP-dependent endonuclease of the OLD family
MQVARIEIKNFRGIQSADIFLTKHSVLLGDNNTGKTTILEALDLALGPDRLSRSTVIDEHDFFLGKYLPESVSEEVPADPVQETQTAAPDTSGGEDAVDTIDIPKIVITVTVIDLSTDQIARFGDYIEFWGIASKAIYTEPNPEGVDVAEIRPAIRVTFEGQYDEEEDDFSGDTYFTRSMQSGTNPDRFTKKDKQFCGFLYLRSVRTGSRALSLEKGSLLDIILRMKEVRPQMWEETIAQLEAIEVASNPELGITGVLESINAALKKYVPKEWGIQPHLKVSNLTREHLRKVITAFIATGESKHAAPFYRQGTGTINMLVLAMLSQIAEGKQNVIFAMEEPETAIPPYAQKRIIHEVRKLSSQSIFTSHSPYVLEEFSLEDTHILSKSHDGIIKQHPIDLPANIKLKRYRQDFRTRFCEGLLSRRVLVAEGATEADSIPVVFRRLAELRPDKYSSLEALGICTVDAGGEGNIPGIASLYKDLGKQVFSFCDSQTAENEAKINEVVEFNYMHNEKGFESFVIKHSHSAALERFIDTLEWPAHLAAKYPNPKDNPAESLGEFFKDNKGTWGVADFLAQCNEDEVPQWLKDVCVHIGTVCNPKVEIPSPEEAVD